MDTKLLRTWLGLPPGPWPPDDRDLLGIGLELVSPADVELRALEQMDKLRPHQLVHPDLVTEGMNRLAQAMIALTSSAPGGESVMANAPAATTKPTPARPPKPKRKRSERAAGTSVRTQQANQAPRPTPEVLEAEPVVSAEPLLAEVVPSEPGVFLAPDGVAKDPLIADEVPSATPHPEPTPGRLVVPPTRREAYVTLVQMRKLIRGLEQLRPFYSDPGEQLLTPLLVFEYIRAVRGFRAALRPDQDANWPIQHGRLVLTVASHPLSLALFRTLVPSQRQAVAADWATAVKEMRAEYHALRDHIRSTKPRSRHAGELRAVRAWLRSNPEWLPAAIIGAAFLIALIRTVMRSS